MSEGFFKHLDEARLVQAIRDAERRSRGEIRVHVTEEEMDDALTGAKEAFEKLAMTATAERNGVLLYIAPKTRRFAVLGDSGLTSRAGTKVLDEAAAQLSVEFREGHFTEGLITAIERLGNVLAAHFPRTGGDDVDELSNEISRG